MRKVNNIQNLKNCISDLNFEYNLVPNFFDLT